PRVKKPRVKKPRVKKPRVKKPRVKKPRVKKPRVKKPEVKKPEVKTPDPKTITAEDKAAALSAYKLGIRALLMGKTNRAVTQFKRALAKNPKLARAYRSLGLAYEKSGKAGAARKAFGRYLRMTPRAPDAASIRQRMKKL
ncbi:MAG: tetratricopeptide repeat protein, partial [Deltaproteobacteria bacterium]|nr:tetratricopeptide repeat protein [Deltaproteobacteria bacterium]